MKNKLQKKIMRRVYYSFAVRTVSNPALLHGFFMLGMLIILTYFVSLGNVLQNMLNVKVGQLDTFVYNAVTNTEAWTLVLVGFLIFSALSLRFKVSYIGRSPVFAK